MQERHSNIDVLKAISCIAVVLIHYNFPGGWGTTVKTICRVGVPFFFFVSAEKKKGICLRVTTDYTGVGKLQYIAGERSLPVLNSEYTDRVILELLIPFQDVDEVQKAITESTNGRAKLEKDREMYFAVLDGEVLTFEE